MPFTISKEEIKKRSKNIQLGLFFSILFSAFIVYKNYNYPKEYNDVLFWSVIGFVILGNLVNYFRYRRYLRMVKDHWVKVQPQKIQFHNKGEITELDIKDISALNLYRKKEELQHIQIKLRNNRGIRLEGYGDLEKLGKLISEQVPNAHIRGLL